MFSKKRSFMSKEALVINLGRVLQPKSVKFSKWQVDKPIRIPIHQGPVPFPLWPLREPIRVASRQPALRKRVAALAVVLLGLWACVQARASQSISLAWNASTDSSTVGYIVYAGSSSTNYTAQMDVGTNLAITLTGLAEGHTNYFAVSAYNSAQITGVPSAQISYITPGLLKMTPGTGSTRTLNFPTAPGHWYAVEASTDLKTWTTVTQTAVATTNAWFSWQDPQSGSFSKRFYRLIMH